MSKMSREEKLFRNESTVLEHYRDFISREHTPEETNRALRELTRKYKVLLDQTRFLTWISGMLERKLQRSNRALEENNRQLQNTLNDLTKAEASKSAYAVIYFIAIALFVLEEFFVEPVINMFGDSVSYSILIKLVIVLMLKISEGFIERRVTRTRRSILNAKPAL